MVRCPKEGSVESKYLKLKYLGIVLMPLYYVVLLIAYALTIVLPELIYLIMCLVSVLCFALGVLLERPYINTFPAKRIKLNGWINVYGFIVAVLFSLAPILVFFD